MITGATMTGPKGTMRGAPASALFFKQVLLHGVQPGPPNCLGQPKPSQPFLPRILAQRCMSSRVRRRALCTLWIADIIGTIDGIAFQTNILALNAAVEAAGPASRAAALRWWPARCAAWPSAAPRPPSEIKR
jgi:hypothetical protein